jgi:hypothetical protein
VLSGYGWAIVQSAQLPRWLAWVALVIAVVAVVPTLTIVAVAVAALWTITVSIITYRRLATRMPALGVTAMQ